MNGRPWKLVALLVGIFLAGGVTGGFIGLHFGQKAMMRRGVPEQWGPARLKVLAERLDLTPAQIERLKPIIKRDVDDLGRLRQQSIDDTRRIIERMEKDIAAVLTPEQKAKFEEFNREQRERVRKFWEQRRNERRPAGADGREPPPPPPPGK